MRKNADNVAVIAAIILISFARLPAVILRFAEKIPNVPQTVDTGLDTGIRGIIDGFAHGSVERQEQEIDDLFATTQFRQRLPDLYHQRSYLERFPHKLFARVSQAYPRGIEILWIFDLDTASDELSDDPIVYYQEILAALIEQLSESDGYPLEVADEATYEPKPGIARSIGRTIWQYTLPPLVLSAVAFPLLWIILRRRTVSSVRVAGLSVLIPAIINVIVFSLYSIAATGALNPTYRENSFYAWSGVALEQRFNYVQNAASETGEYVWSAYPETQQFLRDADFSHPPLADDVAIDLELFNDSGVFRMSGSKKGWLSMPKKTWDELTEADPSNRLLTRWLRDSGSLAKRERELQEAFEIFSRYAGDQGVSIETAGEVEFIDNYPRPPRDHIYTVIFSLLIAVVSLIVYRLIESRSVPNML